jgi:hypothetical protein
MYSKIKFAEVYQKTSEGLQAVIMCKAAVEESCGSVSFNLTIQFIIKINATILH